MRKKRRAISRSFVVERKKSAVESTISDYYSRLTTEEAKEQTLWGNFAVREFPNEPVVKSSLNVVIAADYPSA